MPPPQPRFAARCGRRPPGWRRAIPPPARPPRSSSRTRVASPAPRSRPPAPCCPVARSAEGPPNVRATITAAAIRSDQEPAMYEVYALKYAERDSPACMFFYREASHAPVTLHYFVWLILGGPHPVLYD